MNLLSLKTPLQNLLKEASDAILEIYQNPALFDVNFKSDQSPLTAADTASNNIICEGLKILTPEIPIISEENKTLPYEERKDYEYCWLVDPLDGTKEFVKRNGEFSINVALVKSGEVVLGVLYIPITNECFFGAKGHGAYKLQPDGDTRLHCADFNIADEGLRVLCSRSHLSSATQEYLDKLRNPQLVPKGSALKFTVIAEGAGDVYPRIGPTMEWDTAAAQIILEEAGGGIVEFASGKNMTYNKESLLNPDFVAFGKGAI